MNQNIQDTSSADTPATKLPPARQRPKNRIPLIVAGIGVLGLMAYMIFGNANNNLVYYVLPSEYKQSQARYVDKTLRMGGLAKNINYNRNTLHLRFDMTDGQTSYPVTYQGAVPDLFRPDAVVVMEGQMQDGVFAARSLLVKHSEEYTAGTNKSTYDKKELKKYLDIPDSQ